MAAVATPHHTRDSLRTRPKCIAQRHRSTPARRDPHTDALARQSSILQFRHRSLKRRRGYAASSIGGFADRPGRPSSCRTRGLRGGPPNRYYMDEVISPSRWTPCPRRSGLERPSAQRRRRLRARNARFPSTRRRSRRTWSQRRRLRAEASAPARQPSGVGSGVP